MSTRALHLYRALPLAAALCTACSDTGRSPAVERELSAIKEDRNVRCKFGSWDELRLYLECLAILADAEVLSDSTRYCNRLREALVGIGSGGCFRVGVKGPDDPDVMDIFSDIRRELYRKLVDPKSVVMTSGMWSKPVSRVDLFLRLKPSKSPHDNCKEWLDVAKEYGIKFDEI